MESLLSNQERAALSAMVSGAQRVAVTCHQGPDGDAVGSVCAAVSLMRRMGKQAVGVAPNAYPDFLAWVPGARDIIICARERERAVQALSEADLVLCLDFNTSARPGEVIGGLLRKSGAALVMMDHHLDPEPLCDLTISRPLMCSTCELLLRVMNEMGWAQGLTRDEAAALYCGMMTDTGAFTYASNRPEIFECVAQLLREGIDKDEIYRNVFWSCTEGKFRLQGYLLYAKMDMLAQRRAALMTLTVEEYRRFNVKNGDTEGLVNIPLQIEGVTLSIFLREDTEERGKIRVSTRSAGSFPCNRMAEEFFNGGGHLNAAGGHLLCSMDEAVEIAQRAVKKYTSLLI